MLGFDSRSEFLFTDGSYGRNVSVFGANMSSSVHINNKNNFWWRTNTRIKSNALTAEAKHPINFTQSVKRFVLSLHYNVSNNFLFVNATKIYQFKAKDSEMNMI